MRGMRRRDMGATTYFDIGSSTYFSPQEAQDRAHKKHKIRVGICE